MSNTTEINEFLCGPLVTWFINCLEDPNALTNYDDLVDGVLIHNVYLQIDPEPLLDGVIPSGGDVSLRIQNLEILVENMKQYYEKQLGHLLLAVPDIHKLGKEPERHVAEAKLLLLLLLGCAVQCSNKEDFITKIKSLNVDTQLAIVDCIKQVTDYQNIVLTQESMENLNMGSVFTSIKKLIEERNVYRTKWKNLEAIANLTNNSTATNNINTEDRNVESSLLNLLIEVDGTEGSDKSATSNFKGKISTPSVLATKIERFLKSSGGNSSNINSTREDSHRYLVELADWKSKVRKQRQELEEKTEALIECKEELEHNKILLTKLKEDNQELLLEARAAKSYRDELDAAVERAEKADRLEAEVARYREKLTDIEYYKSRIEELREDNRVLMETREMLEEQLISSRKRAEKVIELETEIIKYEKMLNDLSLERVSDKDKYQEVCEENAQLQRFIKTVASEVASNNTPLGKGSTSDSEDGLLPDNTKNSGDNRLSEQLSNNAQARALKLELENRRLTSLIDSIKEKSFQENSSKLLELEKENKKLSLKVESLSENLERLNLQNSDLESLCKQSLEENKKLQNCLSTQRATMEKQQHELQTRNTKFIDLERKFDSFTKDRQRLQTLLESAERRVDEAEKNSNSREKELNELKLRKDILVKENNEKIEELESKLNMLEKEKDIAQKEIQKLRILIEKKDVAIDESTNTVELLEKKLSQLSKENENLSSQISRLKEIERSSKELNSQAAIDREALESLQSNLVAEKISSQQVHATFEKLGLDAEQIISLPAEKILDKISEISEVVNRVLIHHHHVESKNNSRNEEDQEGLEARLAALQTTSENLLSEKTMLQVLVTRLESESAALSSQQAALRQTNANLEAELNKVLDKHTILQKTHQELIDNQKRLQTLHEQLGIEYEKLSHEKETLKANLRDAKNESRLLKESSERLESKLLTLQTERDTLVINAKSLANLRVEHSKLKEDFRNLYTNTESLKHQYRNLQEDYRKNKLENNRLNLKQTEMQGELSAKDERCSNLELQVGKLSQRCEMLLQMNTTLDNDRRSLMDHVSLVLKQYHELLTHSMEDKERYFMEEKSYTEKVNNLCRQKEKLEEKIMEHYRKLDSCSNKTKKSLGASLVRKVRKAGSGLFTRNSRRSSWGATSGATDNTSLKSSFTTNEGKSDDDIDDVDDDVDDVDDDEDDVGCEDDDDDDDSSVIKLRTGINGSHSSNFNESEIIEFRPEVIPDNLGVDTLSLAHPGTRRTVYYTDSTISPSLATKAAVVSTSVPGREKSNFQHNQQSEESCSNRSTEIQNDQRPLLIYNKVSAVINDNSTSTITTIKEDENPRESIDQTSVDNSNDKDCKPANSVWYEYGCV